MNIHGFARIAVCSPVVAVGNPDKNANAIIEMIDKLQDSDIIVFPELCVTGYTCGDLFRQKALLDSSRSAIEKITNHVLEKSIQSLVFIGAPIPVGNELFNCAIAIQDGIIIGIVPKTNMPNYAEFYESRWFRSADGDEPKIIEGYFKNIHTKCVPFGTDLFFKWKEMVVFTEICEDLWMPIPPSSYASLNGANILVNLSASNETVGKNEYRVDLVKNQSARCVAAYAYASAGPSESTTDLVFGGHCLVAENGNLLTETARVGQESNPKFDNGWYAQTDVDVEKLQTERRLLTSFGDARRMLNKTYRTIEMKRCHLGNIKQLKRTVNASPFIPSDPFTLHKRCAEIFGIQCAALTKRLQQTNFGNVYIGVSGGLDSTLALLVAVKTYKQAGQDLSKIHGITLPGFGTTGKTKKNALDLMTYLGISQKTIDIRKICLETFKSLGHKPFGIDVSNLNVEEFEGWLRDVPKERRNDLVFENVQARERTKLLMSSGFVLGTGDMSELALGWCTYNGDHMSMYNVNCSIPKTLVTFLVEYVARNEFSKNDDIFATLMSVVGTVVSPELLPAGKDGEIEQSTEDVLGPYELHDFYLANFIRSGFSPKKIIFLSDNAAFSKKYTRELRIKTLQTFLKRFFSQQFKRSCVPDGPKVGSVSLSPRGDWRMPSDANAEIWLAEVDELLRINNLGNDNAK